MPHVTWVHTKLELPPVNQEVLFLAPFDKGNLRECIHLGTMDALHCFHPVIECKGQHLERASYMPGEVSHWCPVPKPPHWV